MDKFLGLPLRRKPLTDAEYVARARKEITRWQRYGKWLLLLQALPLIAWICLFGLVAQVCHRMGAMLGGQAGNFALGGLFIGMLLGLCFGVPFLHAWRSLENPWAICGEIAPQSYL